MRTLIASVFATVLATSFAAAPAMAAPRKDCFAEAKSLGVANPQSGRGLMGRCERGLTIAVPKSVVERAAAGAAQHPSYAECYMEAHLRGVRSPQASSYSMQACMNRKK